MKKFYLLIFIFCAKIKSEADWGYPEIDDAVVLNPINHDQFIKEYDEVLVYYYLPGCKYCVLMDKFFDKLALEYKEKDTRIPFATFNCSRHIKYCNNLAIPTFPFVKFYIRGHPIIYYGNRTKNEIDNFIQSIMDSTPQKILMENFQTTIQHLVRDKPVLFFFGKKTTKFFHIFDLACKYHNDLKFYFLDSFDIEIARNLKLFEDSQLVESNFKNGIVSVQNFKTHFFKNILSFDNLDNFIYNLKHPNIIDLDNNFLDLVTIDPENFMILFTLTIQDELIQEFERFAKDHKKGMKFVIANQDTYHTSLYNELKEKLLIDDSELPCVRIFETTFSLTNISKYKLAGDLNYNFYQQFLRVFKSSNLHEYLQVEELEKDQMIGNFKVLNAYTFQENIYVSGQDSILLYHSDFEQHEASKKMLELLTRISNKEKYKNIKYFTINADKNEMKSFFQDKKPVVLLYSKRNLLSPLIYDKEPIYKQMTKFIKSKKNVTQDQKMRFFNNEL